MDILRFFIKTVILWSLAIFLAFQILSALKSGAVNYQDSYKKYFRGRNPIKFWSLIILYLMFIALSISVWIKNF